MTLPSRVGPESPNRPDGRDPFLEFEPEKPEKARGLPAERAAEPLRRPASPPAFEPLPARPDRPRRSAISPAFGFALGIAGLVTATVAYYQMGQLLSRWSARPPLSSIGASGATGPVSTRGRLEVTSDPSGATVSVDGTERGVTPLTLAELPAGRHDIVIRSGQVTVTRTVSLTAGTTATVVASVAPAGPKSAGAGWVMFESPIELNVFEKGRSRGTTRAGRFTLSEGVHELDLVNDAFDVRQAVSVTVAASQTTRMTVAMPMGSLSVNALPWADIWVNGNPVGTTPLANLALPLGSHEILWRHPTFGERRQTVVVKARLPVRVGVDMTK